jgi:predicted NUDIX family NTP pyrophosphohydrolase
MKRSAGVMAYRVRAQLPEVFLVHPGGPFWTKKDDGAWSIPKGLYTDTEDPLAAARREFEEETGIAIANSFVDLGEFKQPGGKLISAWAVEADLNAAEVRSNTFEMEWPPKSGRRQSFPEVDRAAWFDFETAGRKLIKGQVPILMALAGYLGLTKKIQPDRR